MTLHFRFLSLLFLLLFISGCISPKEAVLPLKPPSQFSQNGTLKAPDEWWENFDDPVLDQLIVESFSANLDLKAAYERVRQARALTKRTRAGLFPDLDATFSASKAHLAKGEGTNSESFSAGLDSTYEIDLWNKIGADVLADELSAQSARQAMQAIAVSLAADIALNWYEWNEQQGQLKLLKSQREIAQKVLEVARIRFSNGKVKASDVWQQQQFVESIEAEIILTETDIALLKHSLQILLGRNPKDQLAIRPRSLPIPKHLPETGVPAELVLKRPDLKQALLSLQSANSNAAKAYAERFPSISLSASLDSSASSWPLLFDTWFWNLGLGLTAPLLKAGSLKQEQNRAESAAREAAYALGQKTLQAFKEVEDALIREARQHLYVKSLQKQIAFSYDAFESLQNQYTKGSTDYTSVLDALRTTQSLERSEITARYRLISYRIALYKALGGDVPGLEQRYLSTHIRTNTHG